MISASMATLQCAHVYFFCVLVFGMLLIGVSFRRYNSMNINEIFVIADLRPNQISSAQHKGIEQQLIPGDQQVSYPWIGDSTCQHLAVQFAKNKTRPKWALTSFPGSGVTWTRQLIEGVTGIYTGTVYGSEEPPIVSTGYHGNEADLNCDCTILIKDHDGTEIIDLPVYLEVTSNFSIEVIKEDYQNRGILLLRNPIDALFSFVHYLMAGQDQRGTVSLLDKFKGPQWNSYVNYVTYAWADHAIRWIQNIRNGTVIFYEKLLLEDTEAELNRLLSAIHFTDPHHPPVDPDRMRCTLKHRNRLDRKRSKKPTVPLRAEQHSKILASIERVQESLRQKGWPLLPLHLYTNLQKQQQTF